MKFFNEGVQRWLAREKSFRKCQIGEVSARPQRLLSKQNQMNYMTIRFLRLGQQNNNKQVTTCFSSFHGFIIGCWLLVKIVIKILEIIIIIIIVVKK